MAVSRILSPADTGTPSAVLNAVMCFGPGSCMTGWISGSPQVGSEVKSRSAPQLWSVRSRRSPPPWRCAPAATKVPLSGMTKSDERE